MNRQNILFEEDLTGGDQWKTIWSNPCEHKSGLNIARAMPTVRRPRKTKTFPSLVSTIDRSLVHNEEQNESTLTYVQTAIRFYFQREQGNSRF